MTMLRFSGAALAVIFLIMGADMAQAQQHAIVNGQRIQPRAADIPDEGMVTDPAAGVTVDPKTNSYVPLGNGKAAPLPPATDFYGKPFTNPDAAANQPVDTMPPGHHGHKATPVDPTQPQ